MAKGEYILNIGDDNVVLVRLMENKVANAWLGSPDPALATEELGEALAEDPKAPISLLFDTLDQSFKEEEIPKVGILDRRKILARHVNMAFPGMNLRGARLVGPKDKTTQIYEFASIPLDGRIPGWIDFAESLPNEKAGIFTLAAENIDMIQALAPKDAPPVEQGNHWRHLIGINVTGGLRQIIEKNGRLCLTRLTQAPPPETPPDEFADMIIRDFKATITYIRRLGYTVGDALDLVILTTAENKVALDALTWEGARSVSFYTPYEAGAMLGLGSIGREDQASSDVLHAAWFASKPQHILPLTRAATLGTAKDDMRELAYLVAPYAAGVLVAAAVGWTGWTGYQAYGVVSENHEIAAQTAQVKASLAGVQAKLAALPYDIQRVRNVIEVNDALTAGQFDVAGVLQKIASALQSDAVVLSIKYTAASLSATPATGQAASKTADKNEFVVEIRMRLADVIVKAEEAVQTSRRLNQRLVDSFGKGYAVKMTKEPVGAQSSQELHGDLLGGEGNTASPTSRADDHFYAEFTVAKTAP